MSKINDTGNIGVLGLILLIITACAGALLGFVNDVTKEPIRVQEEIAKNNAYVQVLPTADGFEVVDYDIEAYPTVLAASKASNEAGYVVETMTKGYGGSLKVVIGIDAEGIVTGMRMLQHNETPGLGANANQPSFIERLVGKGPEVLEVSKTTNEGNNVQAITGATITSKAIVVAINDVLKFYEDVIVGGAQ